VLTISDAAHTMSPIGGVGVFIKSGCSRGVGHYGGAVENGDAALAGAAAFLRQEYAAIRLIVRTTSSRRRCRAGVRRVFRSPSS
jgi:hypothetical protein